jgi:hypothetical protein
MTASSHQVAFEEMSGPTRGANHPSPTVVGLTGVRRPTFSDIARIAAIIAVLLMTATCAAAILVHVALAAVARGWLDFPFAGLPARPSVAARIFLHNLRALMAVAGLLLVAQSPFWDVRTPPAIAHRILRRCGEAVLATAITGNVIVVGASLGAYGARMIRAVLPHGPVELAAYALALALYIQGRERPLPARLTLTVAVLCVAALMLAAALETFVTV